MVFSRKGFHVKIYVLVLCLIYFRCAIVYNKWYQNRMIIDLLPQETFRCAPEAAQRSFVFIGSIAAGGGIKQLHQRSSHMFLRSDPEDGDFIVASASRATAIRPLQSDLSHHASRPSSRRSSSAVFVRVRYDFRSTDLCCPLARINSMQGLRSSRVSRLGVTDLTKDQVPRRVG